MCHVLIDHVFSFSLSKSYRPITYIQQGGGPATNSGEKQGKRPVFKGKVSKPHFRNCES
jgi:hypothetical protein